jgi:hypothetical protein
MKIKKERKKNKKKVINNWRSVSHTCRSMMGGHRDDLNTAP